ncbi:DUF5133 domain-containing protein [Streptomyces xanthophaeus]|uniref:DUF5133 domain-containing protein n=1 Tax=Streptomyces xanthophaeus TaxID=67385 RepID=UPI00341ED714
MPLPAPHEVAQAVGMLMASTPARAREAERILADTAAQAGLPESAVAAAVMESSQGAPAPAAVGRALRHAIRAARTPDKAAQPPSPCLLPLRSDAERAVGRFIEARLRLKAAPADPRARRVFEDCLFTLCVLMGRPCPAEALREAVQYTES